MSKPFDELRERLLRDGIAPRRVRRYIAELEDHLNELRAQEGSEAAALARLGTAEGLAKPMLDRREFRSWTARAPWAVMVLGPTLTMIVTGYALWFGVVQLMLFYRGITPLPDRVFPMPLQNFVHVAAAFTALILPLMIGWAAAGIAIRQRLRPLWPLIGLVLFAVISGTFGIEFRFAKTPDELNELTFGFSWLTQEALGNLYPLDISPVRWIANVALLIGPYLAWRFWSNVAPPDGRDIASVNRALS
jgi:hypothetical protein